MSFDFKAAREELAKFHTETSALTEKAERTEDEQKTIDANFAKMDALQKQMDEATRLSKFSFDNPTDPKALKVEVAKKSADQVEFEASAEIKVFDDKNYDRKQFGLASGEWFITSHMPQQFATITGATQSGILLPHSVVAPNIATAPNTFREGLSLNGALPLSTGDTSLVKVPVMDAAAGGVVTETDNSENENPPALTESITLDVDGYESGTAWFSQKILKASQNFDLFSAVLPDMVYSKELGFESAIAAAIIADSGISQTVTLASTTSAFLTYSKLQQLNRKLPKRYDRQKFIVLGADAFNALEGAVDSNGRPILTPDAQNQALLRFNGTPVLRSDYFEAFGSAKVIGCVISCLGFKLRDENVLIERYINQPGRVAQVGANLVQYHDYGYSVSAVAKLKTA